VRKMKLPTIAKLRIPILLALVIGEAVGLLYFRGQPTFYRFVVRSVLVFLYIIPALWLDFMRRIKVKYLEFLLIPMGFSSVAVTWKDGDFVAAVTFGVILIFYIGLFMRRLHIAFRKPRIIQGGRA